MNIVKCYHSLLEFAMADVFSIFFFSKVNIWDVNCAQGIAFIFDTRTDVLVKGSNHKFHSAAYKYNKMHNFVTEMCTHVHISVTKWCIVGFVILVDSTTVATCSSIIYIYIFNNSQNQYDHVIMMTRRRYTVGTSTSAGMVLTWILQNIPCPSMEGLNHWDVIYTTRNIYPLPTNMHRHYSYHIWVSF